MKWQSIAPVDGIRPSAGIMKYSASQQGYAGSGRHRQDGYTANPRKQEADTAGKTTSAAPTEMTEFHLLLKKSSEDREFGLLFKQLIEGNEKMKMTAKKIKQDPQNEPPYVGTQVFWLNGYYMLNKG